MSNPIEGLRVERRSVLALPALLAAAPVRPSDGWDALAFDALAQAWTEAAADFLPRDAAADEVYVGRLHSLLARLARNTLPDYVKRNESADSVGGPIWFGDKLFAVQFELQPGATISCHDHPPMVVATLGIEGACRYTHYEWVGSRPDPTDTSDQRVRESRSGVLEPGRVTALTRLRDGLHTFRAGPQGARIVDFVCAPEPGDWSYVSVGDAVDADARVYEAVRTGKAR